MHILIVNDHPSYCEGLALILEKYLPHFQIEWQHKVSQAISHLQDSDTNIDLIIFDINFLGLSGLDFIEYINHGKLDISVVILLAHEDCSSLKKLLGLEISGFIPKYYSSKQLVSAIKKIYSGERYIPISIQRYLTQLESKSKQQKTVISKLKLTKRQLDVLFLLEKRLTNREISQKLFISLSTVKTHLSSLFVAFKVSSREQCIENANNLGVFYNIPESLHE